MNIGPARRESAKVKMAMHRYLRWEDIAYDIELGKISAALASEFTGLSYQELDAVFAQAGLGTRRIEL